MSLHFTCRHFTSSHLNFTQLHFTTLSFGLTPYKFPTVPFNLTSQNFTQLHFTTLHYPLIWLNPIQISYRSIQPHITKLPLNLITQYFTEWRTRNIHPFHSRSRRRTAVLTENPQDRSGYIGEVDNLLLLPNHPTLSLVSRYNREFFYRAPSLFLLTIVNVGWHCVEFCLYHFIPFINKLPTWRHMTEYHNVHALLHGLCHLSYFYSSTNPDLNSIYWNTSTVCARM